MRDFKEIYELPLVLHGDRTITCPKGDLVMMADEDIDIDDVYSMMDIINEESDMRVNNEIYYSDGVIYIDNMDYFKVFPVIPERYGISGEEAMRLRDEFGKYVVRQLNDVIKIVINTKGGRQ